MLRKVIIQAANKHVGKKKVGRQAKAWMSKEIKEKIKIRNNLRKSIKNNRQQWIESCREVATMIRNEKQNRCTLKRLT